MFCQSALLPLAPKPETHHFLLRTTSVVETTTKIVWGNWADVYMSERLDVCGENAGQK